MTRKMFATANRTTMGRVAFTGGFQLYWSGWMYIQTRPIEIRKLKMLSGYEVKSIVCEGQGAS